MIIDQRQNDESTSYRSLLIEFFFNPRPQELERKKEYVTVLPDQRFPNRKAQTPTRFANTFAKNRNAFLQDSRVNNACRRMQRWHAIKESVFV